MTAFDKLYEKTHPHVEEKVKVKDTPVDLDDSVDETEDEELVVEEGVEVSGEESEEGENE